MSNKPNILLYGQLVIDRNEFAGQKLPDSPGGPAYFGATVFASLGANPIIASSRGTDYNDSWLKKVEIYPTKKKAGKTLEYRNKYNSAGKRTLIAKNLGNATRVHPAEIPDEIITTSDAVIVCPLTNDMQIADVKELQSRMNDDAIFVCLPQGYFRRFGGNGEVYQDEWKDAKKFVQLFDFIILSEVDGQNINTQAQNWSKDTIVIVTRAEMGCSVFQNQQRVDYTAFPIKKVINPVGAGDVFAAAFVYSYLQDKNIERATSFANAAGALSVCCHPQNMKFGIQEIEALICQPSNKKQLFTSGRF